MKRTTTRYDFIAQALDRIRRVMDDEHFSHGYKLVALMNEAAYLHNYPLSGLQADTPDLFAQPQANPFTVCTQHFKTLLSEAAEKKAQLRFVPDETVDFKNRDTSVLHEAYRLKKNYAKKAPELVRFFKLVEKYFPDEVAEDARMEKRMAEKELLQKQEAMLYKKGDLPSQAYEIYNSKLSPSRKYLLLMENAFLAYQESPPKNIDIAYGNPELLVSLYLTNTTHLLKHAHNGVEPKAQIADCRGDYVTTPLQYAEEMAEECPALSRIFTARLQSHQNRLDYLANKPMTGQADPTSQKSKNKDWNLFLSL